MVNNIPVFSVHALAMVLCMQQSHNKATTGSKSNYISSLGEVSCLQHSQVIAGSFLSSSCSSQLQFNNLLSSQAKPYPEAASDVSTVVVTMAAALLAAVTMTMYTVCVQDVPTSDLSFAYNYSDLGQLPTVQTQDLCAFSYATLMMLNNCLLSNTKKMMFEGEEVTPVVMLHVLLATLSMHRHIVQISCLVNV